MKTAPSQKRSKTDRIVCQKYKYQCYFVKWSKKPAGKRALQELLGANIRACRLDRGWTTKYLASEADVHVVYLRQIERGKRACGVGVAARIAEALDVPLRKLLGSRCKLSRQGKLFAQEFVNGDRRLMDAIAKILKGFVEGTLEAPDLPQAPDDGRRTTPERDFADLGRDRPKAEKNKAPID